jgi:hypothetical protein
MMTNDKRGDSALVLQRQLAIRRDDTDWMLFHKLRRAMVNRQVRVTFPSENRQI